MNPEVEQAIPELLCRGILTKERASSLLRIARGELVSIHAEIRLLYYLGVLVLAGGAALLVADHYQQIGPLAAAIGIGAAAVGCLAWAEWKSPPFSRGRVDSASNALDYVVLLGVLLAAADLAFIEVQFTPAGPRWPWHLLMVALFMAVTALRFDSRAVFSLALSSFAAWRGVSVSLVESSIWQFSDESVRINALGCGLLFIGLGWLLARLELKSHFKPVALNLGWLLILGALALGGPQSGGKGAVYIAVLSIAGGGLAWRCLEERNFVLFSFGVTALYFAILEIIFKVKKDFAVTMFLVCTVSIVLIAVLWKINRKMRLAP